MLPARDAIEDRVKGLDSGADDCLFKPSAASELVARLHVLIRRTAMATTDGTLHKVWKYDLGDADVPEVHIGYSGKKTDPTGEPRLIQTVYGVGYELCED